MTKTYVYRKKGKQRDGSAKIIIEQKFKGTILTKQLPPASELWAILEKIKDATFSIEELLNNKTKSNA